jgi:beta-glucanase (GH16 family)
MPGRFRGQQLEKNMSKWITAAFILCAAVCAEAAKGDSSREQFMATQKAQYNSKGWAWDQNRMDSMFAVMDANSDGIVSGDDKKAYWADPAAAHARATGAPTPAAAPPAASAPAAATGLPVKGYTLAWADEFDGTELDETVWEYRQDTKHWSTQLPRNITVADGVCSINLRKETANGMDYTGGGIISRKKFRYGYYEARVKVPSGAGWHTSFWMMDSRHKVNDSSQIELDPLENDSVNLHEFSTDYHQWRSDIGHMKRYQLVTTPAETPLDEWRVYGMEWTPEAAHFYLDGKLVRTADDLTRQLSKEEKDAGKKPLVRTAAEIEKNDVQIWFTSIATWLGGTEKVDDSILPATARCDYIRFYETVQ